ncbi:proline--tRNA ligase [Lancefieldella parvula]|uniref:proline--tRNA ligase n=1 Tax=Lancefieldella parvula TaxID=1382 RepID=UPI0035CA2F04
MKHWMRMSSLYAPTLKEDPAEAVLASHRLLLRAGMIRKTAAGLYSYLPLAWRSLLKIEAIIRDEMDGIGAQEILVPIMTPAELWEESGRWDVYGDELMRMHDRHDRQFALGPTHEETFTDLIRNELKSYKQLPVTLYQIQDKFRDERRPRFGLMRGREFIMKDGYSFSANQESLQECYDQEKVAYQNVCDRTRLRALQVVADSGQIGGDTSVEFMALAEAGEASLVYCDCGYAADTEAAAAKIKVEEREPGQMCEIHTPDIGSIDDVAEFLHVSPAATRKALALVDGNGKPVVCFVPGTHELNEVKAEHAFGEYHMMTDEELDEFGLIKGFIGPVGLPEGIRVVGDLSLEDAQWWLCGANKADYHLDHVELGRDFEINEWKDLVTSQEGDICPECGLPLHAARGIEVGQVFQLGTKYSSALNATFTDENGQDKPLVMGCYGIGVSRLLAAVVEQYNDEKGIKWPVSVAPYEVSVLCLSNKDPEIWDAAGAVADACVAAGLETVVDDRAERPGVKFADADLIGFPWQVIVGKKGVTNGIAEVKERATGERFEVALDEVASWLAEKILPEREL